MFLSYDIFCTNIDMHKTTISKSNGSLEILSISLIMRVGVRFGLFF